jgi:hypothetical protein
MLGGSYLGDGWLAGTALYAEGESAFTLVRVTGTFTGQAGQPASGTVTFTLTQPMSNGNVIVPPQPIVAILNSAGHFSVWLYANDDPETVPQGVQYGVTEQIVGAQPRDFYIAVSREQNPVDLSALTPAEPGWM